MWSSHRAVERSGAARTLKTVACHTDFKEVSKREYHEKGKGKKEEIGGHIRQ